MAKKKSPSSKRKPAKKKKPTRKRTPPTRFLAEDALKTMPKVDLVNHVLELQQKLKDRKKIVEVIVEKTVEKEGPIPSPLASQQKIEILMFDNAQLELKNLAEVVGFLTNNNFVKSAKLA